MKQDRRKLLKQNLDENLIKLEKASRLLEKSYLATLKIGIKNEYIDEELEKYESLT